MDVAAGERYGIRGTGEVSTRYRLYGPQLKPCESVGQGIIEELNVRSSIRDAGDENGVEFELQSIADFCYGERTTGEVRSVRWRLLTHRQAEPHREKKLGVLGGWENLKCQGAAALNQIRLL